MSTKEPLHLVSETARSGELSATLNGVRLHSAYDPRREARRLIEAELPPECDVVVCYGLGLGYHVEELLRLRPGAELVVLEPDPALLDAASALRDLAPVLSNARVRLLAGAAPEAVAMLLDRYGNRQVMVLRLRSVYEKDREYYEAVDTAVARLRSRAEINRNTLKRFGRLWVRNLTHNLVLTAHAAPLRFLEGMATDLPVLLCAAGPSLDSVLPHIQELAQRCLVIAVDTSAARLMQTGVQPDVCVVVDPQYWNSRHLDTAAGFNGILVSESSTHPRVFRVLQKATRVFCASLFPLGKALEEASEPMGELGAGGSVATAAWDLARRMGAARVITAGLDLGFPGKATHCKGSFFEERARLLCSRLDPLESHSFRYLHDAAPYWTASADGGSVLTDRRMEVYHRWFEDQLTLQPEPPAFTLSGGGAALRGVEPLSTQEALSLPPVRATLDTRLQRFHRRVLQHAQTTTARMASLQNLLYRLCEELAQLRLLSKRAGELASNAAQAADLHQQLRRIDAIDQEIRSLHFRDVAGFLIQDTVGEIERTPAAGGGSALENSTRLYAALSSSSEYHEQLLRRALSQLSLKFHDAEPDNETVRVVPDS